MAINVRILGILGAILVAFALVVGTALAASPAVRPGWGTGDTNGVHTGPPGGGSTRPGVGTGDTNHTHTGAPGQ